MERLTKRYIDFDGNPCVTSSEGNDSVSCMYKLAEYEDLEEQGLLLKLPCKVGDTVWKVYRKRREVEAHKIIEIQIGRFQEDETGINTMRFWFDNYEHYYYCHFGKTVFLTQAEAEEVLKGMEGGK